VPSISQQAVIEGTADQKWLYTVVNRRYRSRGRECESCWLLLYLLIRHPRQESIMSSPPHDPKIDDVAPTASVLTAYTSDTR